MKTHFTIIMITFICFLTQNVKAAPVMGNDRIVVKFNLGVTLTYGRDADGRRTYGLPGFDVLNSTYGVKGVEKLFIGEYNNSMSQYYTVYFPIPPRDINTAIADYSNLAVVELAEPIYVPELFQTFPNDPLFNFEPEGNYWDGAPNVTKEQWYLYNDGDMNDDGIEDGTLRSDIHAPEAWNIQTGSSNVILGMIDTGLWWDHPDIINNLWTNSGEEGNPDELYQPWLSDDVDENDISGDWGDINNDGCPGDCGVDDDNDGGIDFEDQEIVESILNDDLDDDYDTTSEDEPDGLFDDSNNNGKDDDADVTAFYPELKIEDPSKWEYLSWFFNDRNEDGWWDFGEERPCNPDFGDCEGFNPPYENITQARGLKQTESFRHDYIDDWDGAAFDDDENGYVDDVISLVRDPGTGQHGTMVAGVAGAEGKPSDNTETIEGIAGVMWDCKIMPLLCGVIGSQLPQSLHYASKMEVNVVNMSVGVYSNSAIETAIQTAYTANIVLVAAAGNDDDEAILYPASHNSIISVASTDPYDVKANYSNYHEDLDVCAPGKWITRITPNPTTPYSTDNGGTSHASPQVAGLAGLIISEVPDISNDMVRDIIKQTANNIDALNPGYEGKLGDGRINAGAALQLIIDAPVAPSNLTLNNVGGNPYLNWDANEEADIKGYNLYKEVSIYIGPPRPLYDTQTFMNFTTNTSYTDNYFSISSGNDIVKYWVKAVDITNQKSGPSNNVQTTGQSWIQWKQVAEASIPKDYSLSPNYPNPFNPTTTIRYDLPEATYVSLVIYDILGRKVRTLRDSREVAGFKSVVWDGKDDAGNSVSTGIYIYLLKA